MISRSCNGTVAGVFSMELTVQLRCHGRITLTGASSSMNIRHIQSDCTLNCTLKAYGLSSRGQDEGHFNCN